ncbi:tryptophan--tRNA ligase [Deferribacterales bacterium RsTz2092]|nr:tryptophan--tRNA ligase [Deferribacterales bacterium]
MTNRKKVFSAMRPTGALHLGHYFGALQNWVKMQDDMDCVFGVADWHALTTNYADPEDIKENTRQLIIDWLSIGLDSNKAVFMIQSQNLAHAELYLLLGMVTPIAWLERTPSYKEMRAQLTDKNLDNYGFLGYPVLMTADIIIYDSDYVPVGIDQVPHVELSREIVRHFHALYKTEVFVEPQPILTDVPKLPGLDGRKMSKSYGNSIALGESADSIEQKLKRMVTDTNRIRKTDTGNPDVCPVFDWHKVFSTQDERAEVCAGCRGAQIGCIDCKKILIKHVESLVAPIRERRKRFEVEVKDAREYIKTSQLRANEMAEQVVERVRQAIKI